MRTLSRRIRGSAITLYNLVRTTAGVAVYQRTVFTNVFLDTAYQQRQRTVGFTTDNTAQVVIDLHDTTATNDRAYTGQNEWGALTDEAKESHFTAGVQDFFVVGEVTDELPTTTKAEMLNRYRCYAVTSVSVPASPHATYNLLEVMAK